MSPATIKLWQVIEREVGYGGQGALSLEAFLAAAGGTSQDATQALNQLLQSGVIRTVTDKELQLLGQGKTPAGRFVIVHGSDGKVLNFFSIEMSPEQYRHALSAKRILLIREIQQLEAQAARKKAAAEAAIQAHKEVLASIPKFPISDDLNLTKVDFLSESDFYWLKYFVNVEFGNLRDSIARNSKPDGGGVTAEYLERLRGADDMRSVLRSMNEEALQRGGDPQFAALLRLVLPESEALVHIAAKAKKLHGMVSQLESDIMHITQRAAQLRSQLNWIESELASLPEETPRTDGFKRESIPENVRNEVWRRDQGRCVQCGSQERLHFDHIIPVSKGGSNTARNLQLLCETCNLVKSDKI